MKAREQAANVQKRNHYEDQEESNDSIGDDTMIDHVQMARRKQPKGHLKEGGVKDNGVVDKPSEGNAPSGVSYS